MKIKPSGTAIAIAALTAVTILHLRYRVTAPQPDNPLLVSAFTLGNTSTPFAQFALAADRLAAPVPPDPPRCRIVVVFSPTCPYCHTAAATESATPQDDRLPTTWITYKGDSLAVRFTAKLRPEVQARFAPDVMARLKVQAVPAAFLIDAGNVVRRIWVYQGDEDHAELKDRCT